MIVSEEFRNATKQDGPIFNGVYELLTLGKSEEEIEEYNKRKPLLSLIESFIVFNLNRDSSYHKFPAFLCFEQDSTSKRILIEYLTTRFSIFSRVTFEKISHFLSSAKLRGGFQVPPSGSPLLRKIPFHYGKYTRMPFFEAYIKYVKVAHRILLSVENQLEESNNLLVCGETDVPDTKTSIVKEFISISSFSPDFGLSINTELDGNRFYNEEPVLLNIPDEITYIGDGAMIYTRSDRGNFSERHLKLLSDAGYDLRRMFVFALIDKEYKIASLKRYINKITTKYNTQPFFVTNNELGLLCEDTTHSREVIFVGGENDSATYENDIRLLLEGFQYRISLRNILSLCVSSRFEQEFAQIISKDNPYFEEIEDVEIFHYMRELWKNEITHHIYPLLQEDEPIAFIIDKKAIDSKVIKQDIQDLFPNNPIHFYILSDLKRAKGKKKNGVNENLILQFRFVGFDERWLSYPNSYDYTVLDPGQRLIEIIPRALFDLLYTRSNNRLSAFYNKEMNTDFRKNVLGWKKLSTTSIDVSYKEWDYDEDDEQQSRDSSYNKVKIEFTNKRSITQLESSGVIYKSADESIHYGRLSDIVEDDSVVSIQLMNEIEDYFSSLISAAESKNKDLERVIREKYINDGSIPNQPNVELWRLLLLNKVLQKGQDIVIEELSVLLKDKELRPSRMVQHWIDIKNYQLILPRRNGTKRVLFDYLGIPQTSPYKGLIARKKLGAIRSTRNNNYLIDQLVRAIIDLDIQDGVFESLYSQIPDALDIIGITSDEMLEFIQSELLNNAIHLQEVKKISKYEE